MLAHIVVLYIFPVFITCHGNIYYFDFDIRAPLANIMFASWKLIRSLKFVACFTVLRLCMILLLNLIFILAFVY